MELVHVCDARGQALPQVEQRHNVIPPKLKGNLLCANLVSQQQADSSSQPTGLHPSESKRKQGRSARVCVCVCVCACVCVCVCVCLCLCEADARNRNLVDAIRMAAFDLC